jgi:(E)-4-hydroxy-3-methylbut-2-enyl-diphosphate synthase
MDPGKENYTYSFSPSRNIRRKTRVVQIGDTSLGGEFPIRIQTMTNRSTLDTRSIVEQCIRIAHAGSDYIRLAVQNVKEAENLAVIKKELQNRNIPIPLIADIHFNPTLAEIAARIVEKVRINPGNFISTSPRTGKQGYSENDYQQGYEKIAERLIPLLTICKEHGTALRIGVNHGSLSDRIMDRFGDTPAGMVESALEFVTICEREDFHQLVLSMKSSNTRVMAEAYRLLVEKLDANGFNYPLHLGVTEAGLGEEGRIKSAVGIGALLNDGIGDTIRISLTEDPECEIPVARKIVSFYSERKEYHPLSSDDPVIEMPVYYTKRNSVSIQNIGGDNPPVVIADASDQPFSPDKVLKQSGHRFDPLKKEWIKGDQGADLIYLGNQVPPPGSPDITGYILNYQEWKKLPDSPENFFPLFSINEYCSLGNRSNGMHFLKVDLPPQKEQLIEHINIKQQESRTGSWPILILSAQNPKDLRSFVLQMIQQECKSPVILYNANQDNDYETFQLKNSCDLGVFFIDGLGDGIWLNSTVALPREQIIATSFTILQACRVRISSPEYISCPSCGRTLFDLQKVTAEIRKATAHLKGIKIGIMGCIVNGPGEMADADYGYVGSGQGKVTLFKNRKIVKKGVSSDKAVDELIELIKDSGDWIDP